MARSPGVVLWLGLLASASAAAADAIPAPRFTSPASGYAVEFVRPVGDAEDSLWSEVRIAWPDGGEAIVRSAAAPRAGGDFVAFSWRGGDDERERDDFFSPDGRFAALRQNGCSWLPGSDAPVICSFHAIVVLSLDHPDDECRCLILGRYSFSGWADGKPHTVIYTPALDGEVREADLGTCPPIDAQVRPPSDP